MGFDDWMFWSINNSVDVQNPEVGTGLIDIVYSIKY